MQHIFLMMRPRNFIQKQLKGFHMPQIDSISYGMIMVSYHGYLMRKSDP